MYLVHPKYKNRTMASPNKLSKTLCIIASSLLIFVGLFHGSGYNYINEMVHESNLSDLIKGIFPVLFILPTIHLIGFGIFGLVVIYMKQDANKVLIPLSILILIDAGFAFYLSAVLPGVILLVPALIFLYVASKNKTNKLIETTI